MSIYLSNVTARLVQLWTQELNFQKSAAVPAMASSRRRPAADGLPAANPPSRLTDQEAVYLAILHGPVPF